MNGVMMPGVSAGSNHVGASETWTPQVSCPSGAACAAWAPGMATAAATSSPRMTGPRRRVDCLIMTGPRFRWSLGDPPDGDAHQNDGKDHSGHEDIPIVPAEPERGGRGAHTHDRRGEYHRDADIGHAQGIGWPLPQRAVHGGQRRRGAHAAFDA